MFLALVLLAGAVLTACSPAPSPAPSTRPVSGAHPGGATPASPSTTTTEQPGWAPVSTVNGAIAVDQQTVTEPDGAMVTVVRFRAGQVHFNLHVGSLDPPVGQATIGPDNGSAIGPGEAPVLLAAFNGGFESSTGAGGFEVNGETLVPMLAGAASLVIDTNGTAHIGVWGQGTPAPGESVASVRQNLAPLVLDGRPSLQISNINAWGATLGGGSAVARSSLGEDAHGNLLYAASMHAVPADLANALTGEGAVTAMELDINPEWVQLDYAGTPGGALSPGVPGQTRPADEYHVGWTRDFITVLANG